MKFKRFFRIGLPTVIAIILAAALLIIFATPLKYGVETESSDFDALPMFSCRVDGDHAEFTLPDGSFNEKITLKFSGLHDGELKSISQIEVINNSSVFKIAGQNIRIENNTAYVILTGFRQALIAGPMESFGFAVNLK